VILLAAAAFSVAVLIVAAASVDVLTQAGRVESDWRDACRRDAGGVLVWLSGHASDVHSQKREVERQRAIEACYERFGTLTWLRTER
jgi:hypothetical protein